MMSDIKYDAMLEMVLFSHHGPLLWLRNASHFQSNSVLMFMLSPDPLIDSRQSVHRQTLESRCLKDHV